MNTSIRALVVARAFRDVAEDLYLYRLSVAPTLKKAVHGSVNRQVWSIVGPDEKAPAYSTKWTYRDEVEKAILSNEGLLHDQARLALAIALPKRNRLVYQKHAFWSGLLGAVVGDVAIAATEQAAREYAEKIDSIEFFEGEGYDDDYDDYDDWE